MDITKQIDMDAKITKLKFGRTYNTGDYTNTRLDVEIDTTSEADIAGLVRKMDWVMDRLKPIDDGNLIEYRRRLDDLQARVGRGEELAPWGDDAEDLQRQIKRIQTAHDERQEAIEWLNTIRSCQAT